MITPSRLVTIYSFIQTTIDHQITTQNRNHNKNPTKYKGNSALDLMKCFGKPEDAFRGIILMVKTNTKLRKCNRL